MYHQPSSPFVLFMDVRNERIKLCDGRIHAIHPDVVADFRSVPFPDASFSMVVFDPPHLLRAGTNSWLRAKYGVLSKETWKDDIRRGFDEAMRVLKSPGFLVFKWNEEQIPVATVLKEINYKPLFGDRRGKTLWMIFVKP